MYIRSMQSEAVYLLVTTYIVLCSQLASICHTLDAYCTCGYCCCCFSDILISLIMRVHGSKYHISNLMLVPILLYQLRIPTLRVCLKFMLIATCCYRVYEFSKLSYLQSSLYKLLLLVPIKIITGSISTWQICMKITHIDA